jgi:hypothetical protein
VTEFRVYTAANGHDWTFYALPQAFAPYTDYVAEHCGSGERIIEAAPLAAPPEAHAQALADLIRMVEAWRWRGQE